MSAFTQGFLALKTLPSSLIKEAKYVEELAKDFSHEIVIPRILEYEDEVRKNPEFLPYEFLEKANQWKLFSRWIPKFFGGEGLSPSSMHFFNEELSSHCMSMTNIIGVHYVGISALSTSMAFSLLNKVCKEVKKGEKTNHPKILSIAATEPNAGTDLEDMNLLSKAKVCCKAEKVKGGYKLNGTKIFISNGHLSEWSVVTAFLDLKNPSESQISFLVHKDFEGFEKGKIEKKLGQAACPASELIFKDVFIPEKNVVYSEEKCPKRFSFEQTCEVFLADVLNLSRAGVGSIATGLAKSCLDITLEYILEQKIEDNLAKDYEWVQRKIGQMAKNVHIARLSTIEALRFNDLNGPNKDMNTTQIARMLNLIPGMAQEKLLKPMMLTSGFRQAMFESRFRENYKTELKMNSALSSMAKSIPAEMANENCKIALELLGINALENNQRIEKITRDAMLLNIYEGSNAINDLNVFNNMYAKADKEKFLC